MYIFILIQRLLWYAQCGPNPALVKPLSFRGGIEKAVFTESTQKGVN